MVYLPYQLVQDFFHQQYQLIDFFKKTPAPSWEVRSFTHASRHTMTPFIRVTSKNLASWSLAAGSSVIRLCIIVIVEANKKDRSFLTNMLFDVFGADMFAKKLHFQMIFGWPYQPLSELIAKPEVVFIIYG